MAKAIPSDARDMLPAVRAGKFGALAALMDCMREADPEWVEREWDRRLGWVRERVTGQREWRRVPLTEDARRSMKAILLAVNTRLRAGWRLPPMRSSRWRAEPLASVVADLRHELIKHVRAVVRASEPEPPTDDSAATQRALHLLLSGGMFDH